MNGNRLAEATSFYQELAPEDSRVLLDPIDDSTDPERIIEEKTNLPETGRVLKAHLSPVEYLIFFLYLQGLSCREIQQNSDQSEGG